MKSLVESILKKSDVGIENTTPENFVKAYFGTENIYVIDDALFFHDVGRSTKVVTIDKDFPDFKKFHIAGMKSWGAKMVIKSWETFKKHFYWLGCSENGRCELKFSGSIVVDDPDAEIDRYDLERYDFQSKLSIKRAKRVSLDKFAGAKEFAFSKKGIGMLLLPGGLEKINLIEIR